MAKIIKNKKQIIVGAIVIVFLFLLFSFRITKVPPGVNVDEAAFGYNGVLLSRTLHDETGRYLPLFTLSINGTDWRQPVLQYFIALLFTILKPSTFTLRLSSVITILLSISLIYLLTKRLLNKKAAIISVFVFSTIPILMIQSHLAFDNITPIPFTILWLYFILKYEKQRELKYLFLSGVSLGFAFYSYKAMRIIVPVWFLMTLSYIGLRQIAIKDKINVKNLINPFSAFSSGLFPFLIIMPLLRKLYPGALTGGYRPPQINVFDFFLPVLSSFDPSFLFIKGDLTVYHSTGIHGVFLLASLPFFLTGIHKAIKSKGFWWFVLGGFFLTPLMFGLVQSVYRASRLLSMVPSYVLISTLGAYSLLNQKGKYKRIANGLFVFLCILMILNFSHFLNYYWYKYPKTVIGDFGQTQDRSYKTLATESKRLDLEPFIDKDLYEADGEAGHFFEAAFFKEKPQKLPSDMVLPDNGMLMTYREEVPNLKRLDVEMPNYYLFVNEN